MLLLKRHAAAGHTGLLLDLLLAGAVAAPHGLDKADMLLENLLHLVQASRGIGVLLAVLERLLIQRLLNVLQQRRDGRNQIFELDHSLFAGIAANQHALTLLDVTRTDLQAQRHTLHLVFRKLPAGAVVGQIDLCADARRLDRIKQLLRLFGHARLVACHRDDNQLDGRNARRQDKALVVAVGHDDRADQTGGNAPRGLLHILQGVVLIRILHIKCLGKAVAEVMARAGLQRLAVMHHGFDGVGLFRTRKALLFGLFALEHRDSQIFLAELRIDVQHAQGFLHRLLGGGVHGVTLLPPELAGTQEGTGSLFPAHNRAPLVIQLGQIAPRADDLGIVLAEQGLGGRADAQALLELFRAAVGDPGDFRRKALNMVLLLLQQAFRDKNRHGYIFVAGRLEHAVQHMLDILPQRLRIGAHDDTALDRGIVDHLGLFDNVRIPLGKIHVHGRDLADQLFLICHTW